MVEIGTFRLDLYHRINVFPIYVPSLAERLEDLPQLAKQLIKMAGYNHDITPNAIDLLCRQVFPGNIRELKNIITRAIVLSDTKTLNEQVIQQALALEDNPMNEAKELQIVPKTLQEVELSYWQSLVTKYGNDKEKIAQEAGVSLRTLYRKLEKL